VPEPAEQQLLYTSGDIVLVRHKAVAEENKEEKIAVDVGGNNAAAPVARINNGNAAEEDNKGSALLDSIEEHGVQFARVAHDVHAGHEGEIKLCYMEQKRDGRGTLELVCRKDTPLSAIVTAADEVLIIPRQLSEVCNDTRTCFRLADTELTRILAQLNKMSEEQNDADLEKVDNLLEAVEEIDDDAGAVDIEDRPDLGGVLSAVVDAVRKSSNAKHKRVRKLPIVIRSRRPRGVILRADDTDG
jgi:hypothetical protein